MKYFIWPILMANYNTYYLNYQLIIYNW